MLTGNNRGTARKTCPKCHLMYRKSQQDRLGIERGLLHYGSGDQPPVSQGHAYKTSKTKSVQCWQLFRFEILGFSARSVSPHVQPILS